jgi:hypothetical protein
MNFKIDENLTAGIAGDQRTTGRDAVTIFDSEGYAICLEGCLGPVIHISDVG